MAKGYKLLSCVYIASFVLFLPTLLFQNSSLQLFDGHNGSAAAIYAKENLLNNVLSAIPPDLNSDEWVSALPRALVAGFVKTDKDFQERGIAVFLSSHLLELWFSWRIYSKDNMRASIMQATLFRYLLSNNKLCGYNNTCRVLICPRNVQLFILNTLKAQLDSVAGRLSIWKRILALPHSKEKALQNWYQYSLQDSLLMGNCPKPILEKFSYDNFDPLLTINPDL